MDYPVAARAEELHIQRLAVVLVVRVKLTRLRSRPAAERTFPGPDKPARDNRPVNPAAASRLELAVRIARGCGFRFISPGVKPGACFRITCGRREEVAGRTLAAQPAAAAAVRVAAFGAGWLHPYLPGISAMERRDVLELETLAAKFSAHATSSICVSSSFRWAGANFDGFS